MNEQTNNEAQLTGAIHNALTELLLGRELQINQSGPQIDSSVRQRMAVMLSGGYDFADTLHNIYLDFGYPAYLSFFNFWNMYRRFGVATRVVTAFPVQTWLDDPIVGAPEAFLNDVERLIKKGLWRRAKGLDTRQRVGRYAGMFMRVRDSKPPHEPLEGTLPGIGALVDMVPLYESQLKVLTVDDDPTSDDFGQPTMYLYNASAAGNRNEKAADSFNIHPSRVVVAAEGADNGGIYGVPALENVYNDLMDLRKILGGGGEGFYKNAAQNIIFDLKDGANAVANKPLLDAFNENYDDFARNRMRRAMWSPGMEAKALESALVSSDPFVQGSLMAIASGSDVPVSVLTGNQTGRLAGDQDTKGFLSLVQARRTDFGTDIVTGLLDWCIEWGVLPANDYTVEWPDAMAPSKEQKLNNADKMADINQKAFNSGEGAPFTAEEIREEAGYDPEELENEPDEELDEEDRPDGT